MRTHYQRARRGIRRVLHAAWAVAVASGCAQHAAHTHGEEGNGWLAPFEHRHENARGTPFAHAFLTEPAFLGRDAFLTFERRAGEEALEAEIEWACTRRIGLVGATGAAWTAEGSGVTDSEAAVRVLLVERERLLFSVSTGLAVPTGRASSGTGADAWGGRVLAHAWTDLGAGFTLQLSAGMEIVPELDETRGLGTASLSRAFAVGPLFRTDGHGHPTWAHAFLESAVEFGDDDTEGEWLLGVSWPATRRLDLRTAYTHDFAGDGGWVLGAIWHF